MRTSIHEAFGSTVATAESRFWLHDIQAGNLYDSLKLKARTRFVAHEFFAVPVGPTKSIAETNMFRSRSLPAPQTFSVNRIVFTFSRGADERDVYDLAENVIWEMVVGEKIYLRSILISLPSRGEMLSPIWICDYCRSVFVGQHSCPGCGSRRLLPGLEEFEAGRQFVYDLGSAKILIGPLSFYDRLSAPEPVTIRADLKLWIHKEGLHDRSVQ